MVSAFIRGAQEETGVEVEVLHATQACVDPILEADGLVFATPECLGSMSGLLKDFFDRCYYPALDRLNGRPYQTLVCAGSDGQAAARQIARIATGWRLKPVADPLIVLTHAQTPEDILAPKTLLPAELERCEASGRAFAAGLSIGVF